MDKFIKVMADFSSTGLWDRQGVMLELTDIPELPFWFSKELVPWCEKYEDYDFDMEDAENDFPLEEFAAEGKVLAQKLAKAMPDWEIWYFDEFGFNQHCTDEVFTDVNELINSLNTDSPDYCYRIDKND